MNRSISYILLLTALPPYFTGYRKEVRPTSMTIKDFVRHCYPIKQGQRLDIMFAITNTGDAPLIISEMQPSCGCITLDKSSHITIPKDGVRQFKAIYNSIKNVGEVTHRIRIFGNMLPNGKAELKFDANVAPDVDYICDYEELYQDFNTKDGIVREMVDGKGSELGYYVGNP